MLSSANLVSGARACTRSQVIRPSAFGGLLGSPVASLHRQARRSTEPCSIAEPLSWTRSSIAGLLAAGLLASGSVRPLSASAVVNMAAAVDPKTVPTAKLNSGYSIPLVGWGTFSANEELGTKSTHTALEAGYRFIDTGVVYGNEGDIGKALKEELSSGKIKREDLFICSKLNQDQHAESAAYDAVKGSLKALNLDYIDLYLIHWPLTDKPGPELNPPAQETWKGLERAVDEGLVRSIGLSNFSPEKTEKWLKDARIKPSVNQVEVHAHYRNEHVRDWAKKNGVHVTAYSPLSSPALVKEMGMDFPELMQDKTVLELSKKYNKLPSQVLLRWGIQNGTSIIPRAPTPSIRRRISTSSTLS
ncbi:hypothetical protein WJX84_006366 [Apatococcus fuscideae]|uniref:NADP-dependent oxidoreductase domain-containing protein n=1 Tax=Apatococcus fuscideae TaxID=2026836 RepID=A0AAW1T8W8_9CHLO